ncbi:aspartate-semialdehyde dehydrogenase [Vibrio cholerae]|nr:aspartate-semialdehyde dehydrogenase [Vibrio cholerae]KAA1009257.1 aspartate-semialdehyde dehydrogenase [Vibrio cholerae]KAA1017845.1 aspartate-semialdehyde dehydrogenase [Vibrio cholerae]KAA1021839.1 aspartate-semialdehyde dehydrogenase [Vibrio cholerae]KAA1028237.1 aspartate-semialdehyde dehydrogenase [Vibrio cholerae]
MDPIYLTNLRTSKFKAHTEPFMRRFFQRLLLPVAVMVVTQTSFVSAESIRLVGPDGQVQPTPQYSENIVRNSANNEPGRFFGPTSANQTLWSIASQLRPSSSVTVQQTLLAIYQLNPQAFENQNIHTLIPGSTLRVPSLAQISRNSTQDAVNIMASHQAKLNQTPDTPVRPVAPPRPAPVATPKVEAVAQTPPQVTPTTAPQEKAPTELKTPAKPSQSTDAEVMALEEKNHTLRLMLSQVQSEVSTLKEELGDENRIRSEVERLLEEERRKAEEASRLAPSALDNLLSNGWLVALLALIPGLLIAIVVLLLLNRRSSAQQENPTQNNITSEMPTAAPVTLGPEQTEDIGDDLLLDDDLFSTTDDKEENDAEKAFSDEDDVFADLNETDLDFNLDGQDSDDLFVGIDDDGDLDTEFDALNESANGISVNADDKALGLEEMERALNDVSEPTDNDDLNSFDLADENQMSEDDIEALLSGDDENELLSDGKVDQSLLDDLLASELDALDDEPAIQDTETLDTLLNDELASLSEEDNDEFDLSGAGVAGDQDLDDLFASIEEQADLEQLEAKAIDETALLDEILAEQDAPLSEESTELLDELLDDFDKPENDEFDAQTADLLQPEEPILDLEEDSTQLLNEVLGEPVPEELASGLEIDQNSTELLDELLDDLDLDDESIEATEFSVAPEKLSVEDGTELFDELLEIEQHPEPAESLPELATEDEFNSDTFIDDLLNSAPAKDPLLEPVLDENEAFAQADDFDFNPEIEGGLEDDLPQPSALPANEFGTPQDEDWVFDEDDSSPTLEGNAELELSSAEDDLPEQTTATNETADELLADLAAQPQSNTVDTSDDALAPDALSQSVEESLTLNDLELPEENDEPQLAEVTPSSVFDEQQVETEIEPESEPLAAEASNDESDLTALNELDLPEYTEEDALADAQLEPAAESEVEPELELASEPAEEEAFTELDELDLPEYTEEDALADAQLEPAAESEVEPELELASEPAEEEAFTELDELDLPEYTEEDALADSQLEPAAESEVEPAEEEAFTELDELDLPEYTEEDALADAQLEPAVESEVEPELELASEPAEEEVFTELNELDLPEYTEEDALADAQLESAAESEVESELELASDLEEEEAFTELNELDLPEYTEEDALADAQLEPAVESEVEPELELASDLEEKEVFTELNELDLPEHTEEDALADAQLEPAVESEVEPGLELASDLEEKEAFTELDELDLPEYTEEDALADAQLEPAAESDVEPELELASDLEEEAFTELNELDLPEYTEEDALADAQLEPAAESEVESELELASEPELGDGTETLAQETESDALVADEDLLASVESVVDEVQPELLGATQDVPPTQSLANKAFDEEALHDWLSDNPDGEKPFSFDRPLDAKTIDSAGMDIDAMLQMGGEDWNGFHLTPDQQAQLPDDVPEDEQAIWASETPEPQAKPENWGSQEDLLDFDPQRDGYMTIDELMAQVESEEQGLNPDEEELKLDVGLDEFPDVIGDIRDIDVDSGAEAAGKLDLAKIYIEMNDEKGAIKLLEEAIVDGDDEIRQQAKRLIDVLNGRV